MTDTTWFDGLKDFIASVGFPIAVAVYLLVSFRKTLNNLADLIKKNNEIIARLCDKLGILKGGE